MIDLKRLRPEDALSFFRSKGLAPPDARFDFRDVWRNEHASNFVVAKAKRTEVLEVIQGAMDRAIANGGTVATFTEELEPELKRLGWWGRSMERDPLTGELKNVELGSVRRLRIMFDANMRASHAAGKWARIERVKDAFPFLRYVQVQRDTKRPEHARYHELIRPVDDPVWDRIYPPNGWRCGCTVQQLSQAMMDRRGQRVTEEFTLQERGVLNRRTGQIEPTALGVDPAWDGNPGKAWLDLSGRHGPISGGLSPGAAATELGFASRARLFGMSEGREHLGAFDLATGEEIDWTIGSGKDVKLSPTMKDRLARGVEVGLVHNHPSSAPLTPDDMVVMFDRQVSSIMAVGHDGSLYRAQLLRPTTGDIRELAEVAAEIIDDLAPGMATIDRDHAVRLTLLDVLQSRGLILYQESLGAQAQAVRSRAEETAQTASAMIIRILNGDAS
ncbi:phage head morphogenesis protein [Roseovarius ramblicola]|uniref:Phage minor head protein n=1 Tax=Roseovarius ramblicola TaxID=2022336 RepID=A0ABV5HWE0_9RHOB